MQWAHVEVSSPRPTRFVVIRANPQSIMKGDWMVDTAFKKAFVELLGRARFQIKKDLQEPGWELSIETIGRSRDTMLFYARSLSEPVKAQDVDFVLDKVKEAKGMGIMVALNGLEPEAQKRLDEVTGVAAWDKGKILDLGRRFAFDMSRYLD